MILEDLPCFNHPAGFQHRALFDNGFGISVIPELTQGEDPLYEVTVYRHKDGRNTRIAYDTEITDDVLRYLSIDDVNDVINRIESLDPAHRYQHNYDD